MQGRTMFGGHTCVCYICTYFMGGICKLSNTLICNMMAPCGENVATHQRHHYSNNWMQVLTVSCGLALYSYRHQIVSLLPWQPQCQHFLSQVDQGKDWVSMVIVWVWSGKAFRVLLIVLCRVAYLIMYCNLL